MRPANRDLYRVASHADVDLATVERYTRTAEMVRPSTAQRIERAMRELGLERLVRTVVSRSEVRR